MVTRSSDLIESRIGNLAFARPRPIGGQDVEIPDETTTTLEGIRTVVEFWSLFDEAITITGTVQDISLPSVTVAGLPTGVQVDRAYAMLRFRMTSNTDCCDNELNSPGTTPTTPVDGSVDAITLTDGMLFTPATDHAPGTTWKGDTNISSEVDGNGTYTFTFKDAEALAANLIMRDVQVGLQIEYSVPSA